jgi:hypothetical protein
MKYIASLDHVLEVTLQGSADLAWWRTQLKPEGLFPTPDSRQRARIWISGASSRFRGIRFRELSITVHVTRVEGATTSDGLFLPHAFNSSRLFTFFERHWFHIPYVHAGVEVAANPYRMSARGGSEILLKASLNETYQRDAEPDRMESWEGPIYLPAAGTSSGVPRRHFFACLAGKTTSLAFVPERDTLAIHRVTQFPVLEWLLASGFQAETWAIRPDARHARSKTFYESA